MRGSLYPGHCEIESDAKEINKSLICGSENVAILATWRLTPGFSLAPNFVPGGATLMGPGDLKHALGMFDSSSAKNMTHANHAVMSS